MLYNFIRKNDFTFFYLFIIVCIIRKKIERSWRIEISELFVSHNSSIELHKSVNEVFLQGRLKFGSFLVIVTILLWFLRTCNDYA